MQTISKQLHNDIKEMFTAFVLKNKQNDFYWSAIEIGQIKNLIARLRHNTKKIEYTDTEIVNRFKYVLENLTQKGYIWDSLSIKTLVNQWETVKTQVRENYKKEVVTIAQKPKPRTNEPRTVQEKVMNLHDAILKNPELQTLFGKWSKK
jgi:hypothetical protein